MHWQLLLWFARAALIFWEEHNRSAVTTEGGYYDTEKGFESLINSCYTPLRFWGGKSAAMAFSETGTDILAPGGGCDYPAIVSYQNDFDGTNPISKEYYDRFLQSDQPFVIQPFIM